MIALIPVMIALENVTNQDGIFRITITQPTRIVQRLDGMFHAMKLDPIVKKDSNADIR